MRTKKIVSQLKKAIKQEHLYTAAELEYMKEQLNLVETALLKAQHRDYKGFGKK